MTEVRLKARSFNIENQNLARRTIGPNRLRIIKERTCFYYREIGHFIKECEEFLAEVKQQILDEQREDIHQERNQRTTRSARRTTGSSEGFRARGVSHKPDISERAW
jgi:HPt (histidine-containing phosphotransfer) domain-containing protein